MAPTMKTTRSTTTFGCGLLLAAVSLFSQAQAQDATPRSVNRDELRACMTSDSDLGARRQAIEGRAKLNRDESAAIRAEAEELKTEHDKIEDASGSMDKFERKVKVHNARVKTARDAAETWSRDLDALNKGVVAHNAGCGRISFMPEDKEAILKERAAAGK